MSDDDREKVSYKQVGIGGLTGASLIGFLMAFQNQGIESVTKNSASQNQIVIEKTQANTERIARLEDDLRKLKDKIDEGFESVRSQMRSDTARLAEIVRVGTGDRFTKTEHIAYRGQVQDQFNRLQDEINALRDMIHRSKRVKKSPSN